MTALSRWYASIRSPYSWLALEKASAGNSELLKASQMGVFLEPLQETSSAMAERGIAFHYTPMSRAKHFYILRDVARLAQELELSITWPDDRDANWEVSAAACISVLQDDQARGKELVLALSRARWTKNAQMASPDVVGAILLEQGLPKELANLHETEAGKGLLLGAMAQLDSDAVFGVPYFRVGRQPFWGVDRLAAAERAFADSESAQLLKDPQFGFDDDHTGGCG